ncbi:thiol peroxidase [Crocinitomicaceae bacterium CZZ-1]|uniref:Thiol peroxidase n=1 Tax=Taishania pollutisoli TaxID=2766479 RepID=A0A8J6PII4_9FLAO|nr:thiol peroxidase [Taishania pollutisoli]MBC9812239.1 thiol peroxidase [Taishania pollutisoli]MBX2950544.1 thiol peroxidase [Crocinitomicaceae bacterium]NGF74623.1 thiol peroxidase [Fluviicola sp. SGL-29]
MSELKFKGNPIHTNGSLPKVGQKAPDFTLVKNDLSRASLSDYAGKKVVLNIFPSIDTGVCATSVRTFNQKASDLENTIVLCVSKDLPFANGRFCGAEGISNVETLSDFDGGVFGSNYEVQMVDGPLKGLLARSIVALNEKGEVVYTELVDDIVNEPDYDAVLKAL